MAKAVTTSFSVGFLNWKSLAALVAFVALVLLSATIPIGRTPGTWMIVAAFGVAALLLSLLALGKVSVTDDGLVVGGGIYKVTIPWEEIDTERASRLKPNDSLKLRSRLNGIGWPGCYLGWFSTNRERKVFAATSGRDKLVYIPTLRPFDIVATPADPEELVRQVRSHARPDESARERCR